MISVWISNKFSKSALICKLKNRLIVRIIKMYISYLKFALILFKKIFNFLFHFIYLSFISLTNEYLKFTIAVKLNLIDENSIDLASILHYG